MSKRSLKNIRSFAILIPLFILITCNPELKHEPIIVEPNLLFTNEALSYPDEAFELGIEGRTVIQLLIDTEGQIVESTVRVSSGSVLLDEAALKMVKSSVYEPGTIDGDPREFELHVPVQFTLDNAFDLIEDIDSWLEQTLFYRKKIETATEPDKLETHKQLFFHYEDLIGEIGHTRSKAANDIIIDIVDGSISQPWLEYKMTWPLGFLLYRDYIKQYPNSEYQENSLDGLIRYLEREKKILEHYAYSKPPYANIYSLILNELINAFDRKQF